MTADARRVAIQIAGLRKSYGTQVVLDGIDLEVAQGTVFALLGPNGAGKTTMVRILSTLIAADGGDVRIDGHDIAEEPDAARALIGVTGQFSAVDGLFTGRENLKLMADLRHLGKAAGNQRIDELLERFDLVEAAAKPVATYSGGMRRRLDLAMTLIGEPRIIFLDEPTAGLDPRSRREMWQIIGELVADGVTIFLTTQYLEEADRLADRIGVLDRGTLIADGTPDELKRLVPGGHIQLSFATTEDLERAAQILAGATRDDEALTLQVPSDGGVRSLRAVLDGLEASSIDVGGISLSTPDLDDVFLSTHRPYEPEGGRAMTLVLTDSATMLRRNLRRHAPLPLADDLHRRHPGRPPAPVRLRLRRDAGSRTGLGGRRPGHVHRVCGARDPPDHRCWRGPRHGHLDGHGQDRGHPVPVPDDGYRTRVRAHRSRHR